MALPAQLGQQLPGQSSPGQQMPGQNQSMGQMMGMLGQQGQNKQQQSGQTNHFGALGQLSHWLGGPAYHLANYFAPQQTNDFFGGLKNFLVGGDENQFSPEQQQVLQYLLGSGLQGLQNPYEGFDQIQNDAEQQFQQRTVPGLAERFTSMGGRGTAALSSPAFATQLGQAGAQLNTGIGALKAQYGQQNRQNAMNQLQMGLQPQTQFRPGLIQGLAPYAAKAGMAALGGL